MHDREQLAAQVERIRTSGVLGRSAQMRRLFDFLVVCTEAGRVPKEVEIAIDAFGRTASFDVAQDSVVRVYIHKLRQRRLVREFSINSRLELSQYKETHPESGGRYTDLDLSYARRGADQHERSGGPSGFPGTLDPAGERYDGVRSAP